MWLKVILLLHVVLAWQSIPGKFSNVEVGRAGVWAVNDKSKVFVRNPKYKRWQIIPGSLTQISVGSNVWGVNKANNIFMRTSPHPKAPWRRVNGALKHVSVSDRNTVWGVNKHDQIYRLAGTKEKPWVHVRGSLKQISVGDAGVWGVNAKNEIYYRQGTYGDKKRIAGSDWVKLTGKFKWISSGHRVFGVTPNDEIFERVGRSAQIPIGRCWRKIGGELVQVDVGLRRRWGVNRHGRVYFS